MQLSVKVAALSMLCLAASACGDTKRIVEHLPTPADRLVCEKVGTRPSIPPEHTIDWAQVKTVSAAQVEHEKYKTSVRTREGIVAGYVLKLEGVNFICWNNMEWRRQYEAGIANSATKQSDR